MTIQFIGDGFESTNRILTQCHSLDYSLADRLGNVGIPVRSTGIPTFPRRSARE